MSNIAIIPIRCGSKGIKDKNIRLIDGKPLVAYTIEAALNSHMFDEVMVSTDSEKYADIARQYGASVPFMRSDATSTDTSSSWSVVDEVINEYEKRGRYFDTLALLQATTPLRRAEDIVNAFEVFKEKDANAVVSVCETRTPVDICNTLPEDFSMIGFYDDRKYKPRQVKKTYYYLNGAIYLYKVDAFKRQDTIYDAACYAYVMDKLHSTDIDDEEDIMICEALLKYGIR